MDEDDQTDGKCERCIEPGVAYNEDGVWLCEDCLFEEQCDKGWDDLDDDWDDQEDDDE